jgi:hypothetical protein
MSKMNYDRAHQLDLVRASAGMRRKAWISKKMMQAGKASRKRGSGKKTKVVPVIHQRFGPGQAFVEHDGTNDDFNRRVKTPVTVDFVFGERMSVPSWELRKFTYSLLADIALDRAWGASKDDHIEKKHDVPKKAQVTAPYVESEEVRRLTLNFHDMKLQRDKALDEKWQYNRQSESRREMIESLKAKLSNLQGEYAELRKALAASPMPEGSSQEPGGVTSAADNDKRDGYSP